MSVWLIVDGLRLRTVNPDFIFYTQEAHLRKTELDVSKKVVDHVVKNLRMIKKLKSKETLAAGDIAVRISLDRPGSCPDSMLPFMPGQGRQSVL